MSDTATVDIVIAHVNLLRPCPGLIVKVNDLICINSWMEVQHPRFDSCCKIKSNRDKISVAPALVQRRSDATLKDAH